MQLRLQPVLPSFRVLYVTSATSKRGCKSVANLLKKSSAVKISLRRLCASTASAGEIKLPSARVLTSVKIIYSFGSYLFHQHKLKLSSKLNCSLSNPILFRNGIIILFFTSSSFIFNLLLYLYFIIFLISSNTSIGSS